MEQWLNFFIQVTKPVLTTIVYTGINTWLDAFQEEIQERHKQQAKSIFKSLTVRDNNSYQELSPVSTLCLSSKPSQSQVLDIPLHFEQNCWPLRLSAEKLREKAVVDPNGLMIFVAPPKKTFPEFSHLDLTSFDFEQRLSQILREFLQKNYSFHAPGKETGFLGGLWDHSHFYGETSIQLLFEQLRSIPCLILETEIQGQEISFNLVYWRKDAQKYHYATIFTFNYLSFLEESVKTRVEQWLETRDQLLQLGKSPADLQRLGGICEHNYALVEERKTLAAAGINTEKLRINYQFDQEDYQALCQFLSICYCLLGGWVTDIHYLVNEDLPPHLPLWLISLGEAFPLSQSQQAILGVTISLYEDILTVLGQESAQNIPELALKLAESLIKSPDPTWAKEPIIYSFACWRQQHQLPETATLETLQEIRDTLSQRDHDYLSHLRDCLSSLPDGTKVNQIREWIDILTEKPTKIIPSPDKLSQFQLQRTVTTVAEKVLSVSIDKGGYQVISQRGNFSLKLWHFEPKQGSLSLSHEFGWHSGQILAVTCSPDGQLLATSDTTEQRSYIKIWQLSTGQIYRTLVGHRKPIQSLAIHLGSRSFIASGSHKIKLWDLHTAESWLTLFGHKQTVSCLAISGNGQTLISGSYDKTLRIWNLKGGELCRTLTGHGGAVKTVILSEDGKTIISGSTDKTIKLWNLKTGKLLCTLTGHLGNVLTLRLDHSYLFSGDETGRIYLWDLERGQLLHTLTAHQQAVQAIALSRDGQSLVSGCTGGKVQLWQALTSV